MSHVTCIIQARSNSTRLPGKLLLKLQGRTLLERAVLQACSIFGDPNVLIAVPHYDAVIRRECDRIQRGVMVAVNCDEHDVLTRFWLAANQHGLSGLDRIARWTPDDWRKDNDLIRLAIAGKPRVSPQQSVETFVYRDLDMWHWTTPSHMREHIGHIIHPTPKLPPDDGLPWSIDTQEDYDAAVAAVGI